MQIEKWKEIMIMNWYEDFKTGKEQDERIAMEGAYFMNHLNGV
jgi:hypothetical protein